MATLPGTPVPFQIRGLYDALDGLDAPDGACNVLQNLIHDTTTPRIWVPRSGLESKSTFAGFSSPGVVSVLFPIGNLIYGLVATSRFAGHDEPFIYDTNAGTFITVGNVTSANTPVSPLTTGDWTPPMMEVVGTRVLVAHPGFPGGGVNFGWFDFSSFSLTSLTGTTANGSATITAVNTPPASVGVQVGFAITGTGIPAGTYITGFTSNTITLSQAATAAGTAVPLTVTGGTPAAPVWGAGNTTINALPGKPVDIFNFYNRAYYAVGASLWFSDALSPTTIANATNVLNLGALSNPIIGMGGIPISQTVGGILAAMIVFKATGLGYWQITGDISTSNLVVNGPIGNIGCAAARTIVQTPRGLWFMSNDGIRQIDFTGLISIAPIKGVRWPVTAAVNPTRASAAFNNTVYRFSIYGPTSPMNPSTVHTEYWYDFEIDEWGGPHTCGQDICVPVGPFFYCGTNDHPGALYESPVDIDPDATFVEFGAQLSCSMRTTTISKRNMSAKAVIEATADLCQNSSYSSGATLVFYNADLSVIGTAITAPGKPAGMIWGTGVWGTGIWGPSAQYMQTYNVDWPYPMVFTLGSIGVNVQSYSGFRIGAIWIRLQDLDYTTTQNPP